VSFKKSYIELTVKITIHGSEKDFHKIDKSSFFNAIGMMFFHNLDGYFYNFESGRLLEIEKLGLKYLLKEENWIEESKVKEES